MKYVGTCKVHGLVQHEATKAMIDIKTGPYCPYCGILIDNVIKNGRETGILNSAESSWTNVLQTHNLITKAIKHDSLKFLLLRENKIWWGDENGNII